MKRNRPLYFLLILLTIGLGLLSRSGPVPMWLYPYLGDLLYAVLFFFIIGFLFPRLPTIRVGLISVGICFFIEGSQLYQADWINVVRSYRLGGLILGYGFLWSDLISYAVGGSIGGMSEWLIYRTFQR